MYKLAFGPKAFVVVSDPIVARHILRENAFSYDKVLPNNMLLDSPCLTRICFVVSIFILHVYNVLIVSRLCSFINKLIISILLSIFKS